MRMEAQGESRRRFEGIESLNGQDMADAIAYIVTRPRHVAVKEMLGRLTRAGRLT
jgi:NADP-dependent 3-hydroxy acid dehydrogenase YdfG